MIKINLLSQRKARKVDKGQQTLLIGVAAVAAACLAVYFVVHRPLTEEVADAQRTNRDIKAKNKAKEKLLRGGPQGRPPSAVALKANIKELEARRASIVKLDRARSVPADMLFELSKILTQRKGPTMGDRTSGRRDIQDKLKDEWDPKSVWIIRFSEKQGKFRLIGGASADNDITSLQHRLQASAYFEDVVPLQASQVTSKDNTTYYKFTIAGKVVY